jgi:hypothetical protein
MKLCLVEITQGHSYCSDNTLKACYFNLPALRVVKTNTWKSPNAKRLMFHVCFDCAKTTSFYTLSYVIAVNL